MIRIYTLFTLLICSVLGGTPALAQEHSVAREWNEILLTAIRTDFARPTVHARNLFHISIGMYDAWAVYHPVAEPYFLGRNVSGYLTPFEGVPTPTDIQAAQEEAISYVAFRILNHRFRNSPGRQEAFAVCDSLFAALGYDPAYVSSDYRNGNPAALGNYLAQSLIDFGLQDGSNEVGGYVNQYYRSVNIPLAPALPGNDMLLDMNRWQPLTLSVYIDQSGNPVPGSSIPFLGPEWGNVVPFAMTDADKTTYQREGNDFHVYHDPGPPPYIQFGGGGTSAEYQWGFSLVSLWSSHLDPADGVMWDISPASLGKVDELPTDWASFRNFYNTLEGGDPSEGHDINPHTGQAYEPQMVPRGDYTRVLAEFWADGPDSETPPGHWFTILNYVNDHLELKRKFRGVGPVLDELEWDVKAYLAMGGAMHDAAISAWGIKGYYDYLRPVSAIRWMAGRGQSSEPLFPNYSPVGIPLYPGLIELVLDGDSLAGPNDEHLYKVKVYAWKGPDYIENPDTDMAGVGWILAENWWPYQRPTFVTPPFAGYISGHSTYSRAAAEVMTLLTGDEFFPGGMGEFVAKKNEFLVFEEGPSVDVVLQWATYRDASDQTSLSRIWGGIHPPADDIPGRIIGQVIGPKAFEYAETFFKGENGGRISFPESFVYPNPISPGETWSVALNEPTTSVKLELFNLQGQQVMKLTETVMEDFVFFQLPFPELVPGIYVARLTFEGGSLTQKIWVN